jgi:hypothetical protein
MHVTEEEQERIANVFLHDAELRLESLPSSLQELIDAVPDHNQQMLDAIAAVNTQLFAAVVATLEDENTLAFINKLFERVEAML